MPLRYVVLDFDGTCTHVEEIHAAFLSCYRAKLGEILRDRAWVDAHWDEAERTLRESSPHAGWTLGGAQAAPAAADPYILTGEIALFMQRNHPRAEKFSVPSTLYKDCYEACQARWRDETRRVLRALVETGLDVCFVSNSEQAKIEARLAKLLEDPQDADLRAKVRVIGSASKFSIVEPAYEPRTFERAGKDLWKRFSALPVAQPEPQLERPLYLRRGSYFNALCDIWQRDASAPEQTLVCGDVWELDLAMPAALGCSVHLIERAAPYETCAYEYAQLAAVGSRGAASSSLEPLIERVHKLRAS